MISIILSCIYYTSDFGQFFHLKYFMFIDCHDSENWTRKLYTDCPIYNGYYKYLVKELSTN